MSDIAVLAVELVALLLVWRDRKLAIFNFQFPIFKLFIPFILWSLFALIIHGPELGAANGLVAAAYWVRLTAHLLLLPALLVLYRDPVTARFAEWGWLVTIFLLAVLGVLQLLLIPDLNFVGWDTHQGRLVSSWLDPNLFGAFLALGIAFAFPLLAKEGFRRLGAAVVSMLATLALLLTRSRTTLLALGVAGLILSPFCLAWVGRRLGVRAVGLVGLILAVLVVAVLLLGERARGLIVPDPTVQLRFESLRAAWQLIQEHPWVGAGYNAYQFAAEKAGVGSEPTIHSRAGADNSWLTVWATTGLVGLVLFLLPWLGLGQALAGRWWYQRQAGAAGALLGLLTLFLHSQAVNSFLYSHLMISLVVICALALSTPGR